MEFIHGLNKFGMNFGLSRTERILELLGNPHKDIKLIHIAGTNGKGSTTAIINSILREAGYKVGMYTSPFIEEFGERIQINGEKIPNEALIRVVQKVKELIPVVIEEGFDSPTEFEFITCVMFKYFSEEKVDFGVIEVGLGGRLDSTNVITPLVSVITSISYDHMNILGEDIKAIALEKSGIIKDKIPVVVYPQEEEVLEIIEKVARERNASVIYTSKQEVQYIDIVHEKERSCQIFKRINNEKEITYELPLLGEHQIYNCNTAISVIEVLKNKYEFEITEEKIVDGIKKVEWMGRMEILKRDPFVVIDGAHNIDGIRALNKNIKKYFNYKDKVLILGILADKQVDEMIREICLDAKEVIAVTPNSDRAELGEDLCNRISTFGVNTRYFSSYQEAYDYAYSKVKLEDLLIISGSLYMIGDMRKIIRKNI